MWYFCKYKDILGKPKTGLHSYRVFNVAIVDVLFTVLLAKFVHYYILEEYNFWSILICIFILVLKRSIERKCITLMVKTL